MLTAGMTVFLERCDQGAQSRRKDYQVTGVRPRSVSVSNASWDEYRTPYTDRLGSVGVTKCKLAFSGHATLRHRNNEREVSPDRCRATHESQTICLMRRTARASYSADYH